MNDVIKKKVPFWFAVILMVLLAIPAAVVGINSITTGYKLDRQTVAVPVTIYNYNNDCFVARNISTNNDYFVPTRSSREWNAFKSSADLSSTPYEVYPCEVPNTECRLYYQYKIDNKIGQIKSTPWTDNTDTYARGPYSLVKTGKDDHCNGSQACGIRVGVQCAASADYGIDVEYEMRFEGVSGGVRNTGYPTAGGAIKWGTWSQREYETGDNECSSSAGGCQIRMNVTNNYSGSQTVTCSIGYQHRTDETVSGWRYDNAWAVANNDGSGDGENCENGGCGLQAELYCEGPPAGTGSPPPASNGTSDGSCGPADGQIYNGPLTGTAQPPVADRCQSGSASGYTYNGSTGEWTWTCTDSGVTSNCSAYNINFGQWNPPSDPGGGGAGSCPGGPLQTICDDTFIP